MCDDAGFDVDRVRFRRRRQWECGSPAGRKSSRGVVGVSPSMDVAFGDGALAGVFGAGDRRAKLMGGPTTNIGGAARRNVDHILIGLGVAAAFGSVAFAGVMLSRDNSRPMFGGVEHLMIFAQPIGGSKLKGEARAKAEAAVDFNATGSIARSGAGGGVENASSAKDYILRVARKGALVIESPKGRLEARPGVVIPDLGTVLSVQNRNGRWRVVTERGVVDEAE